MKRLALVLWLGGVCAATLTACDDLPSENSSAPAPSKGALEAPPAAPEDVVRDRQKELASPKAAYHAAPAALYEQGKVAVYKTKTEFLAAYNAHNRELGRLDVDPTSKGGTR